MRLFTLEAERTGESSHLNGKIFKVRKEKDHILFIDIITGATLWITSVLDEYIDDKDSGVLVINTQNNTYRLLDVSKLIPTKPEVGIIAVKVSKSNRPIRYGDGYDMSEFTFNKEITEDEFIKYLTSNGYSIVDKEAWYQDHSKISGSGKEWTYKWVRVYTD